MLLITAFIINAVVTGLVLWMASKITAVALTVKEAILVAFAAGIAALVPTIGWLLAILVTFYLLKKLTRADIYPDILLMVIVSRLLVVLLNFTLSGYVS